MEEDKTTVRIIVCKSHEKAFLELLGRLPDSRDDVAYPDLVDLLFDEWDQPSATHFCFAGIPFLGYHDHGDTYDPHRMCGDGDICREIYADRDERLYIRINDTTGRPDLESLNVVREYLAFEKKCRTGMNCVKNEGSAEIQGSPTIC